MDHKRQYYICRVLLPLVMLVFLFLLGCASNRYMLDEPVSDPIMACDDQQGSDLVKLEEGGGGAAGGGCPT